jgi:ABC-2 type transport system ATP-binding protein
MAMAERMCDHVCMIFQGRKVLDGTLDQILDTYGEPRLRVALANRQPVPELLPGVQHRVEHGRYVELALADSSKRQEVLRALLQAGEIEHFEMVKPTLHDIFVQIASPVEEPAAV